MILEMDEIQLGGQHFFCLISSAQQTLQGRGIAADGRRARELGRAPFDHPRRPRAPGLRQRHLLVSCEREDHARSNH